jgi:exopolyphosphatase / guanosine-5'-triphosphate,3'-diphosphate pyrophosphatase
VSGRVAAIDIGTNTVLMLIAEEREGELRAIEDLARITRLGYRVDQTKRLDEEAVGRTLAALSEYAERIRELSVERVHAVATSAARDAENGADFCARASAILGTPIEIAPGAREAILTFRGALGGIGIQRGASVAVIDVGGGSTELVVGQAEGAIVFAHSYDVGSVRMTERHVHGDPPSAAALDAISADVRRAFSEPHPPIGPFSAVVAIAGTATTYAAIDLQLRDYAAAPPHGHKMSLERIEGIAEDLAKLPLEERRRTTGLEPKRADVIIAGGIVLAEAARALGAAIITISDRGVRWGLALELAEALRNDAPQQKSS